MKTIDGMDQFGTGAAMKGYVGVSIDYRIGFPSGTAMAQCKTNYSGFDEAWYRAAQDARAAIRYLKANAERLGIDKDRVYIGGHSAGAFTSLNASQLDNDEIPAALKNAVGNLDDIGDNQNQSSSVAGTYVLAGGAIHNMAYIDKAIPTYVMMGTCDRLLPYGQGQVYKCNNGVHPVVYTGPELYQKFQQVGACVRFDVSCTGDHDLGAIGWEALFALVSDFIYKSMTGKCKSEKNGIPAKQGYCQTVDPSVCK